MKVLVVDDSALMRRCLMDILSDMTNVELESARDGADAIDKLHSFQPDVITLDINMPVMDGITCLSHIMEQRPTPVVMVSSITEQGAIATFEALELGAIDYVTKPDGTISRSLHDVGKEIIRKVRGAARSSTRNKLRQVKSGIKRKASSSAETQKTKTPGTLRKSTTTAQPDGVAIIAISTGGPGTIESVIKHLSTDLRICIVIAQHMPASFTRLFAERLDKICPLPVLEINRSMPLEGGHVYLLQGGKDCVISRRKGKAIAIPAPEDRHYTWHPSASRLLESALEVFPPDELIGIMMTGMGNDGYKEMKQIHDSGGFTIAQDPDTAVVASMPKSLIDCGGANIVTSPNNIARHIHRFAKRISEKVGTYGSSKAAFS